jgi:hypothetical protein
MADASNTALTSQAFFDKGTQIGDRVVVRAHIGEAYDLNRDLRLFELVIVTGIVDRRLNGHASVDSRDLHTRHIEIAKGKASNFADALRAMATAIDADEAKAKAA